MKRNYAITLHKYTKIKVAEGKQSSGSTVRGQARERDSPLKHGHPRQAQYCNTSGQASEIL